MIGGALDDDVGSSSTEGMQMERYILSGFSRENATASHAGDFIEVDELSCEDFTALKRAIGDVLTFDLQQSLYDICNTI